MSARTQVWRSEDNLQVSVFSFRHLGLGDRTQAFGLGSRSPYPLSNFPTYFDLLNRNFED